MSDQTTKHLTVHNYPRNRICNVDIPVGITTFMAPATELHWYNMGKTMALVLDKPEDKMRIVCEIPITVLQKALAELGYTLYQP